MRGGRLGEVLVLQLSIVRKDVPPGSLLVRARRPGDIERVFGRRVKDQPVDQFAEHRLAPSAPGITVNETICSSVVGPITTLLRSQQRSRD